MNPQWHSDFPAFTRHLSGGTPDNLDSATPGAAQEDAQKFFGLLADFLFARIGRPRWFLDSHATAMLLHSRIESQSLKGIPFPHDSFNLVFEKGIKLAGAHEIKFSSAPGTGSAKRPHFRGFVLRTLRDERYERNPDGTLRTVLVEPTVIHPEMMGSVRAESEE